MAKKDEYEKADLPHMSDLEEDDNFDAEIEELADEIAGINDQIKELQDTKNEKSGVLRAYLENINDAASWSVRADDERWLLMYVKPQPQERLNKEKLVVELAKMKIPAAKVAKALKAATDKVPVSPSVQVRRPKEKD